VIIFVRLQNYLERGQGDGDGEMGRWGDGGTRGQGDGETRGQGENYY